MMPPLLLRTSTLALAGVLAMGTACASPAAARDDDRNDDRGDAPHARIRITVGTRAFTGTLDASPTATAFAAALPLTLSMRELNGNEKHADLASALPGRARRPGTLRAGDLMLYGSRTLVLFYETFATSYAYTRLGKIDDATGLATALGAGNVTVTFEALTRVTDAESGE